MDLAGSGVRPLSRDPVLRAELKEGLMSSTPFRACRRRRPVLCLLSLTGLAGCVDSGPPAPTVLALPAPGESFSVFEQHDTTCRAYASAQTGGQSPNGAALRSGIGGAAIGTGLGAAAGALLGSASGHAGGGAAIGAGSGLLAGGLLGGVSGRQAAATVQHRYDNAYVQCMVANGERVAPTAPPPAVVYAPPPPVVYVPAPGYPPPPT